MHLPAPLLIHPVCANIQSTSNLQHHRHTFHQMRSILEKRKNKKTEKEKKKKSEEAREAEFVARARAIARSHNDDSMADIISSGAPDLSRFTTRLASSMPVPENLKKINQLLFSCHY
ncbi:unnamed protein product [Rhizopus stolonifer]